MKRNSLLAKSLTLGLAVATAAASMSTPGGLVAPVTVQAGSSAQKIASAVEFTAMSATVYTNDYSGDTWKGKPESLTEFGSFNFSKSETGNKVTVTGTANYVSKFEGFNTAEADEQQGYYVTWQFEVPSAYKDSAVYYLESKQAENVTETLEGHNGKYYKKGTSSWLYADGDKSYFSCITRISDLTEPRELVIDWDGDGSFELEMTTFTLDFSGVKRVIPGTATIKKGDSPLSAAPEVGDELTVAITEQDETFGAEYSYQWYKTKNETTTPITGATSASYTVAAADLGYTLSVGISVKDNTSYNELKSTEISAVVDTTAPTLETIVTPAGENLTDTTATITLQADEDCTVYYVAKSDNTSTMEASAIQNDGEAKTVTLTEGEPETETIENLTANTEYKVFVTAVDAADNASEVQTVTFKTNKTAMAGIASIQTNDGQEIKTLTIGDTVKAVYSGSDTENLKYEWYRIPVENGEDQTEQIISDATAETYILAAADKNCKIKVVISDGKENLSGTKTATTTGTVNLKTGTPLSFAADCYNVSEKKLTLTVPAETNATALQYSTDGGVNWTDGGTKLAVESTTATLTLENQSYAANSIQIRFKETEDTAAGAAAVYAEAITVSLEGSVSISGDLKYNSQITAIVSDAQEDAKTKLKYEFFRVKGDQATSLGAASATNAYTLTADDIGAKIKVVVTAEGYAGTLESTTTSEIAQADAREVAEISTGSINKKQDLSAKKYTYTLLALNGEGAKYAVVAGTYESYSAYKTEKGDLIASDWKDSPEFKGLTPNEAYTFFVTYDQADTNYEPSEIKSASVTIDKLKRPDLKLNVTVEPDGEGKKVTITPVEDALYSFEGDSTDKYAGTNTKTFASSECTGDITVAIKYKDDPLFDDADAQTSTIDLSQETQTAPVGGELGAAVNASKTKHTITVAEEPTTDDGETLEYSLDGYTYGEKDSIRTAEFDAGATVTVYVRKAASEGKFASPAAELKITLPAASAAPAIGGSASFKESTSVTITASANATIYYTTDGSDPTIASSVYSDAIAVSEDTTIKAIAVENGKVMSSVTSKDFTKDTSTTKPVTPPTNNSNSTWSGSTTTTTTPSTDNKKDDNKTEDKGTTTTETKADGTQVTTTETKAEDGSVTAKVELKNETTGVTATVDVAKNADGKVTEAAAAVTQTSADKKAGISAATVAQITEAAGTKDVEIKTKVVDAKGNTVCRLTVNAEDLKAGNQLKVLMIDSSTGEMVLVNKSTYKVDKDGNLDMGNLKKASYMVVTKSEADAFSKAVLKTVKLEDTKKNVTAGKKTKITLDDGLNMGNVAKITYKTSKKSVATVSKNGTITAKKAGKVVVKATVTLKNGKTKAVKMVVTVKASKKK